MSVCGTDIISKEDLITYESLVKKATQEYDDLVDSKWWEPDTRKTKYQDQPSVPKAYTVDIKQSIIKALKQVDFKSRRGGNGGCYGGGSSTRSDITCHKCGKRDHVQKNAAGQMENLSKGERYRLIFSNLARC